MIDSFLKCLVFRGDILFNCDVYLDKFSEKELEHKLVSTVSAVLLDKEMSLDA